MIEGELKLGYRDGNETHLVANVNTHAHAMGFGRNNTLLTKADKALHVEGFQCNHRPHTEVDEPGLGQVRSNGKCMTLVHAGFGVELGLQFEDCVKNLTDTREQWSVVMAAGNSTLYPVGPVSVKNEGYGLLSMGVVSTYFDALAFSFNGMENKHAKDYGLYLEKTK